MRAYEEELYFENDDYEEEEDYIPTDLDGLMQYNGVSWSDFI